MLPNPNQAINHFLGPGIVFEELRQYKLEKTDWDALEIYNDVLKVELYIIDIFDIMFANVLIYRDLDTPRLSTAIII